MSKRQRLSNGQSLGYLWARIHLWFGHEVIWLEDRWGGLYLTVKHGSHAYVYNFSKIGPIRLDKDHSVGGSYIKYWKPYKPGVRYQRARPKPSSAVIPNNLDDLMRLIQNMPSPANWGVIEETELEKVTRINKEMSEKSDPQPQAPTMLTGPVTTSKGFSSGVYYRNP